MEQATIQQLVKELGGIRKAGRMVGIPASTLCEYFKGKHPGNHLRIQTLFEQYISEVECPVVGRMSREKCREFQAMPFRATNHLNAKLKQACKTCLQGICNK